MSLFNTVMRSNLLSKGCKLYYIYLFNLSKMSKSRNWKITEGKYENHNFIIATDSRVSKKLSIGLTSIYKYKKTLKSLGLIDILTKFTTRTNQRRNYHNRQLTVVLKAMPRKLISKLLTRSNNIKKARILKTSSNIISQFSKNLNTTVRNIHTKVKNLLNNVKTTNYINNTSYNNLKNLNKEDVQTVANILNTYNIKFKNKEIPHYIEMYKKSKEKFNQTCKYCSDKHMYAPLKYFTKVFASSYKPKIKFCDFPQKKHNFDELEKLLIKNY